MSNTLICMFHIYKYNYSTDKYGYISFVIIRNNGILKGVYMKKKKKYYTLLSYIIGWLIFR